MELQVFGHLSPDTDSTGSPIIWSWYLNEKKGLNASPKLLGEPNSEALFVLQNIRDEAHRFAIKENRRLRIKDLDLDNTLNIKGVSKSSILDLIKNLKTLNRLSNASLNELEKIINENEAKKVYDYFNHSEL